MIQIRKTGDVIPGSPSELRALSAHFAKRHWARLPGFFDPDLLHWVLSTIEAEGFTKRVDTKIGWELLMEDERLKAVLEFLFNDERLFDVIRKITHCPPIGCFVGRLYRFTPSPEESYDWHDDCVNHRMIAVTVNLSPAGYEGGDLHLRDRRTGEVERIRNTGVGDALIFRLAPHLEHRVAGVTGARAKTALAGWFHSEPSYLSLLRARSRELSA